MEQSKSPLRRTKRVKTAAKDMKKLRLECKAALQAHIAAGWHHTKKHNNHPWNAVTFHNQDWDGNPT